MALLEIKDLTKRFGDSEVLKGISLSVKKGEVVSIIGSSGGGKTTFLRCLNFLEEPDSGSISVDGEPIFSIDPEKNLPVVDKKAQQKLGLVFQQFNLFPQYTAIENLMLAPKLQARTRSDYREKRKEIFAEIRKKAEEILSSVGLSEKADFYPFQLSGGQQQRVAIARALMLEPEILCFDEPTSALDPELTGEVLRVIRELKNDDRTMIIVTHELSFARSVSDKIIFMANGVIEEMADPETLFTNPQSEKTKAFLDHANKE